MTLSQSASSCCSAGRVAVTPALLMTISNRTEARFGGVQRGLDARCDGDVHHHALGLALGSGDIIDSFGQRFRAARSDGHACAPRRKKGREKPSEPA